MSWFIPRNLHQAAMVVRIRARPLAAGGAGPLAVGAVRRRLALVALASAPVLSLLVALAGAGPVGAGAPAATAWRWEGQSWRPVCCWALLWRCPAW